MRNRGEGKAVKRQSNPNRSDYLLLVHARNLENMNSISDIDTVGKDR